MYYAANPMSALDAWHEFFVMVGGAAAALTGLVYVAMSIHLRQISSVPIHRARARATLIGLVATLLLCGVGLFPQSLEGFGIKLVTCGLALAALAAALTVSSARLPGAWDRGRRLRAVLYVGTPLIVAGEGGLMIRGVAWAIEAFAVVILLTTANMVSNAWVLMLEVSDENA